MKAVFAIIWCALFALILWRTYRYVRQIRKRKEERVEKIEQLTGGNYDRKS